eukprot:gene18346-biopygen18961
MARPGPTLGERAERAKRLLYPHPQGGPPTAQGGVPTAQGVVPTAQGGVPTAQGCVPTALLWREPLLGRAYILLRRAQCTDGTVGTARPGRHGRAWRGTARTARPHGTARMARPAGVTQRGWWGAGKAHSSFAPLARRVMDRHGTARHGTGLVGVRVKHSPRSLRSLVE